MNAAVQLPLRPGFPEATGRPALTTPHRALVVGSAADTLTVTKVELNTPAAAASTLTPTLWVQLRFTGLPCLKVGTPP